MLYLLAYTTLYLLQKTRSEKIYIFIDFLILINIFTIFRALRFFLWIHMSGVIFSQSEEILRVFLVGQIY